MAQVAATNNTPNSLTNTQNQSASVGIQNHMVNKPNATGLPVNNHKQTPPVVNEKPSVPMQTVAPTIPQVPKPVALPSPDKPKPNIMSPLTSTYPDSLELSLARLEQDIKSESMPTGMLQLPPVMTNSLTNPSINCNPNLNPPILQSNNIGMDIKTPLMDTKPPMLDLKPLNLGQVMSNNSMSHGMNASIDHELPLLPPNTTASGVPHSNNNCFGIKHEYDMMSANNNGLSSHGIPISTSIPSMFDPLPQQINNVVPIKKDLLHPKPIEELTESPMSNMMDKKATPPEHKHPPGYNYKNKQEHNVKNAVSWSSLASSSPQNSGPGGGGNSRQQVMDSFKAFQKQAKEKADREKQRLENLELKRQQKEQAEKERLRQENERRREKEEEDALEKAR